VTAASGRRGYLDWLRGVAVLIMIEAHTLDSWTRPDERGRTEFGWATVLGGFGAPTFLFLAGVAVALGAGSRVRKGATDSEAAALARRRGWQIFGLAFLFRLQSLILSGGSLDKLVKVDILNVMGPAMLAASVVWGLGRSRLSRAVLLATAAVAVALITPIVRAMPFLAPLPDVIEWYLRAPPGRTMFNLFPWAGFLLAGSALGVCLDAARTPSQERRFNLVLAAAGPAIALGGYAAAYLPAIYRDTDFWTSSPTFFFLRLGILMTALPVAYGLRAIWPGRSRVQELGLASFFVYWIHVEMVYGLLTLPMHRALTFEQALLAFVVFSVVMYWAVVWKRRLTTALTESANVTNRFVGQQRVRRG
jgi:uncharacterized membrane protein